MLGILRINAGISTEGDNELSMTLVDEFDNIYEVDIAPETYEQLVEIVQVVVEVKQQKPAETSTPTSTPEQPKSTEQQVLTNQSAFTGKALSLADVGFIDYSADMAEDDDDEPDPGEGFGGYAKPL